MISEVGSNLLVKKIEPLFFMALLMVIKKILFLLLGIAAISAFSVNFYTAV
jgi:hypothetical protein